MTFTKGEWKARRQSSRIIKILDGDSRLIATLEMSGDSEKAHHLEANAHLIASVPDLYEALKGITAQFKLIDKLYSRDKILIDKAEQALAKAEVGSTH